MKLALMIGGVLAAALFLVLIIGFTLRVKHSVQHEETFAVPADVVYRTITDVESFPKWRSKVERVELVPGDSRRFREIGKDGTLSYHIDEAVADRRLVTRIDDQTLPFGGTWTFDLSATPVGTTVRITEDGEVYNPLFRFISKFIIGHSSSIDTYFEDLRRKFAAGSA